MTIVTLRKERGGERALRERRTFIQAIEWQVRARPTIWDPPSDLFETESAYIVRVEIAGMREQEISVTLDGDVLLIRGTRTDPTEQRAFHQMEIRFGEFTVAALLPGAVDEQTASATYEDGFLVVTLPKT